MARNVLNVGENPADRNIATGTASAYAQTHVNPNQTLGSSGRYDPAGATPVNQTPNNGHEQNQRVAAGSTSSGWGSGVGTSPSYPDVWLRLKRSGATLHGFRSEDGVNWTDQGTTTLTDQQPDMYVGPFMGVETGNIWSAVDHDVWLGPFDPKYDRLFVAQFRNFKNLLPPTLSIVSSGANVIVTYTGTLLSATTVTGPYTVVTGAVSPYTTSATGAARFFRAQGPAD